MADVAVANDGARAQSPSVSTTASKARPASKKLGAGHMLSSRELATINDHPPVSHSERKCTDCLFLLLFIAFWIGQIIIAGIGYSNGNPEKLLYGSDYQGNVCGGVNMTDRKRIIFPRASEDAFNTISTLGGDDSSAEDITFFGVCAKECPKEGDFVCTDAAEAEISTILQNNPGSTRTTEIENCLNNPLTFFTLVGTDCESSVIRNQCWETVFNTTSILFRCLPQYEYSVEEDIARTGCLKSQNISTPLGVREVCVKYRKVNIETIVQPTASDLLFDSFNTASRIFNRYLGDVYVAFPVIFGFGFGFAILLGLFYIGAVFFCIGPMVWMTVLGTIGAFIAFTSYLYIKAGIISTTRITSIGTQLGELAEDASDAFDSIQNPVIVNDTQIETNATSAFPNGTEVLSSGNSLPAKWGVSETYKDQFEIAAYVMTGVTILLVMIVLALASRISRAIVIFGQAALAIRHNLCLVILPFISVAFIVSTLLFWGITTSYIASSASYDVKELNLSSPVQPDAPIVKVQVLGTYGVSDFLVIYLFFGMLWTVQFVDGVSTMIISGAIGAWYWKGASDDEDGANYGKWPILHSIYATFRYHLGTIAFGSLIVAIMQLIRYIAAYIDAKTKNLQKGNKIIMVVMMCVHCFLRCVESCVKFISKNAYIQCAMYGGNFCNSTRDAFHTIMENIAQVGTVNFLGDIVVIFGQLLVTSVAGLASWAYLDSRAEYNFGGDLELSAFWFPVFLSMLLSWFSVGQLLGIYNVAVDTILLQYCQDKKIEKAKQNLGLTHKEGAQNKSVKGFFSFGGRPTSKTVGGRNSVANAFEAADVESARKASTTSKKQ